MKIKIVFITVLLSCVTFAMNAQNFSEWIQDQAHPKLKVRYVVNKDAFGYNTVILELTNTVLSSMEITISICNTDD